MNATRDFPLIANTDEVAAFLRCSPATVREYVRTKLLRAFVAGRSLRFTRDAVEQFIAQREAT
jgi:excisionase family DNA binding protein